MNYHEFALRAEPGVCTCCGITNKQLQDDFLYHTFGDIHIEYIGHYFVPICGRCSDRITSLGRYITSGYYKKELKPPYSLAKIEAKHLDNCVDDGFFHKMASISQAKLMKAMGKFHEKHEQGKNLGPKEYDKELRRLIDIENHRNEYIQVRMNPSYWESSQTIASNGMEGDNPDGSFQKNRYVVTDVYFYPAMEDKKDKLIVQARFLYP